MESFAQQMIPFAQANYFLMSTAVDQKPPPNIQSDPEHKIGIQNKDSVMHYVDASCDYCIEAVKNSDPGMWNEKRKIFGREATKLAFMLKAFEHQAHTLGQIIIYTRLDGIRPPQEKLFN